MDASFQHTIAAPSGNVGLSVFGKNRNARPKTDRLWPTVKWALPSSKATAHVNWYRVRNFYNVWRGLWRILAARAFGISHRYGALFLVKNPGKENEAVYGVVSLRVVTTAGVNFIVDAFQNLVEVENLKFHGFGTGGTAEAAGDTALVTEETTQYNPDNTRPTGTTTEGGGANVYRSVATYSPDSGGTRAITEHGIFSQAATGGGTLLDRSLFSVVNLVAGSDSLQATYDLTMPSGG